MDVVLLSAPNPRAERMGNGDGSQIPGKFPIGKPSIATVVIIYVWRLGRFATVDFWAAAHCTLCLLLNMAVEGEVASCGTRTGRAFRAFQFGALVAIEDTHKITKYLVRFSAVSTSNTQRDKV